MRVSAWLALHTLQGCILFRTAQYLYSTCTDLVLRCLHDTQRRALLLKEALEEINKTKRTRYEAWRRRALSGVDFGRKIRRVIMSTIVPAAVCLYVSDADTHSTLHKAPSTFRLRGLQQA